MLELKWSFDEEMLSYSEISKISYNSSGIYFIYDYRRKLLYIGLAKGIKKRIIQHFNCGSSNTIAYSKEFKYFSVIYEENPNLRRLFESYFIELYKPPYNSSRNPRSTCKGIKKDGSRCNSFSLKNGYCRHHKYQEHNYVTKDKY